MIYDTISLILARYFFHKLIQPLLILCLDKFLFNIINEG